MTAAEKRFNKLVSAYGAMMGLDGWRINVQVYAIDGPDVEKDGASCYAEPEYRTARLRFNTAHIPEEQEARFVRHELAHCLTWELASCAEALASTKAEAEWVRSLHERLATAIETMPIWDGV